MPTTTAHAEQIERQYVELANAVAQQAQALADGTHTAGRHAMIAKLRNNIETLAAWTPDDRS